MHTLGAVGGMRCCLMRGLGITIEQHRHRCAAQTAVLTSAFSYSTKPKPLCCPVVLSKGMFTSLMSPNGMKAECNMASLTFSSRPPTYRVVFLFVPLPATTTAAGIT